MASREFVKLIGQLSRRAVNARDRFLLDERTEEWTKINFIIPLLQGLGWNTFEDLRYESSPPNVEGWLDYILVCHHL